MPKSSRKRKNGAVKNPSSRSREGIRRLLQKARSKGIDTNKLLTREFVQLAKIRAQVKELAGVDIITATEAEIDAALEMRAVGKDSELPKDSAEPTVPTEDGAL